VNSHPCPHESSGLVDADQLDVVDTVQRGQALCPNIDIVGRQHAGVQLGE
jgi:hypothetical protein